MTLVLIVLIGPKQLDQVPASVRNILEWLNFGEVLVADRHHRRHPHETRARAIRLDSGRADSCGVMRSLTGHQMTSWPH